MLFVEKNGCQDQQLYDAFGWQAPEFAHLPLILKPTGKGKLSKRDGAKLGFPVFPLEWKDPKTGDVSKGYKEEGYFTEAVINFLAFLGWNPGTEQENFSLDELIQAFELEKVHKAGARFDPDKIKWFNHHYMQERNNDELAAAFKASQPELKTTDVNYISLVVGLIKERATFVSDFWELSSFFFEAPKSFVEKAAKKAWKDDTDAIMKELASVIKNTEAEAAEQLQSEIKEWITKKDIGFGKVMQPLRLALVGDLKGPDLFQIMFMIGRDATVRRIELAIDSF